MIDELSHMTREERVDFSPPGKRREPQGQKRKEKNGNFQSGRREGHIAVEILFQGGKSHGTKEGA